jgi:hypothetical protein
VQALQNDFGEPDLLFEEERTDNKNTHHKIAF